MSMNRRDYLKLMLTGSVGTGLILTTGCMDDPTKLLSEAGAAIQPYGRTPEEVAHDIEVMSETFFTEFERKKLDILVDLIVPRDEVSGSATDAKVPDFIEFMAKDFPPFQHRLRSGLMWIDHESNRRFEMDFLSISESQRVQILDDIAYPDDVKTEFAAASMFFNSLRNLTLTGFFTTRIGFDDLGYIGNIPNEWDGIPNYVMNRYNFKPDPNYADVYLKLEQRNVVAQWDDEGNLI
jgi:hypothetical protein